jgi:hypothetical protein
MDVEHLLSFIEALDRANNNAVGVFAPEAGLANHVSHGTSSPRQRMKANYGLDGKIFCPIGKMGAQTQSRTMEKSPLHFSGHRADLNLGRRAAGSERRQVIICQ